MLFSCSECDFEKEVSDKYAGKKVKCPSCGISNLLPGKTDDIQITEVAALKQPSASNESNIENVYSLSEFLKSHKHKISSSKIQQENDHIIEFKTNDGILVKAENVIGEVGKVEFDKLSEFESKKWSKKLADSRKGTFLSKLQNAIGEGSVLLSNNGKNISLIKLKNESLYVNNRDILAFEKNVKWKIEDTLSDASTLSEEVSGVKLTGTGNVAISSNFEPIVVEVNPKGKYKFDVMSVVAWSEGLNVKLNKESAKISFLKNHNIKPQVDFSGKGFIILQTPELIQSNAFKHIKDFSKLTNILLAVLFLSLAISSPHDNSNERLPASAGNAKISALKQQIHRMEMSISAKGTQATEDDRKALRRLKSKLLEEEGNL